jgi:hypothetical protein
VAGTPGASITGRASQDALVSGPVQPAADADAAAIEGIRRTPRSARIW